MGLVETEENLSLSLSLSLSLKINPHTAILHCQQSSSLKSGTENSRQTGMFPVAGVPIQIACTFRNLLIDLNSPRHKPGIQLVRELSKDGRHKVG